MASSGITFSGLASGLDTAAIVDQLLQLERLPIQQLESKKGQEQQKLSSINQLKTLLEGLQGKAEDLGDADTFYDYSTSMSNPELADITASGEAALGSHSIRVVSTAATDRWTFDGVTDPTTDLASANGQSISFDVDGTSYSVTFSDSAATSLNEIAAAINGEADGAVTASVVNAGTESSPEYKLVLTSDQSGADFALTNLTTDIAGLTNASNITIGANAVAEIDGLQIERTDNDFSDVIDGVSINLLAADTGTTATFTVDPDVDAVKTKLEGFVDSYNDVINFINSQNSYDEESGTGGVLFGDSLLSSVRSTISSALYNVDIDDVTSDTTGYATLSLVGIEQNSDGTLKIDSTEFEEKLSGNIAAFADLFVDSDGFDNGDAEPNTSDFFTDTTADSGIAATLARSIDRMFDSQDGPINPATGERMVLSSLFDLKKQTIDNIIKRFDKQIEDREQRLVSYEEQLRRRFSNLENTMAQLQNQGAALNNI